MLAVAVSFAACQDLASVEEVVVDEVDSTTIGTTTDLEDTVSVEAEGEEAAAE